MGKTIRQYALGVTRETTEQTNDRSNPFLQYGLGVTRSPDINFINNPNNSPADVDMLAISLDPRVTVVSPIHAYYDSDGLLKWSTANQLPLEYRGGVAVGRHLPEAAATNIFPEVRMATIVSTGGQWNKPSSSTAPVPSASSAPDGAAGVSIPIPWSKGAVYDGTTFLVAETNSWNSSFSENSFSRISLKATFAAAAAASRFYLGRQDATNYLWGLANIDSAGDYVFSEFRRSVASTTFDIGLPQAEKGAFPTSPIDPVKLGSNTRSASSVTVNSGAAKSATLLFSDGTTQVISGLTGTLTLPLSSIDWGKKFVSKISFSL